MTITKDVVSISEMSRMLGLSRGRFYQLMKQGVFPEPIRDGEVRRAHFDRELQEKCIQVRTTNRGINGKVVLFYATRPTTKPIEQTQTRNKTPRASKGRSNQGTALATSLRDELAQIGVAIGHPRTIDRILADCFPDGHQGVDRQTLLMRVFEYVNCRNTTDNLT